MTARRGVVAALLAGTALLATGCAELPVSSADASMTAADTDLGATRVVRGAVYAERETGPLRLDLFLPERTAERTPVVVYVHGGSWAGGERYLGGAVAESGATEALAAERLVERGYAVATVDYRLSGVASAPAQVIDVADAVRWLQVHGHDWGLDPERFALWGASAGGHLAAWAAAEADGSGPAGEIPGLRAVVNWFGPTDMSAEAQQRHPEVSREALASVELLLGCAPVACPDQAEAASPVRNLSGDEPPFLLQHGTADNMVPIEQSLDFAAELRRLGVETEMHPYEGIGHGFGRSPMVPHVIDAMVAFIETRFQS